MNKEKEFGRSLMPKEISQLRNDSVSIVVPKEIHKESRTYKGRNTDVQVRIDSIDLCKAQKCDLKKLEKNLLEQGYKKHDIDEARIRLLNLMSRRDKVDEWIY